jgi:alkaline phosphatase
MGLEHIAAGEMYTGADFKFTDWQRTSVNTDSVGTNGKGPVLTDSAAAGTALATGKLTVNSYIGKDHTGMDVLTIMDKASKTYKKSTGVVTTDSLLGATPSAFSAHSTNRNDSATIFSTQVASGVDLLCGSTDSYCTSRKATIESNGYTYCDNFSKVKNTMSADKTYWQFDLAGATATVALCNVAVQAMNYLDQDTDGFVLMIEQAHIDKYSHSNDFDGMVKSVKSLNDTVEAVLAWIGERNDTAILITADHETGGLNVSSEARFNSRYSNSLAAGLDKIYYNWSSGNHTNSKVGLFVYGIEVDFSQFDYYSSHHLIKNTDVHNLMVDVLEKPTLYVK